MPTNTNVTPAPNLSGGWPLIQSVQTELNRVFDHFNSGPFGTNQGVLLAIDLAETNDTIEITAEIPGVKSEDLDVSISNDTLILKGQKSDTREDTGKDWRMVERSFGSFSRHIPLGFAPKDGQIDVEFLEGVLTLRIAKPADAPVTTRKIDVTVK